MIGGCGIYSGIDSAIKTFQLRGHMGLVSFICIKFKMSFMVVIVFFSGLFFMIPMVVVVMVKVVLVPGFGRCTCCFVCLMVAGGGSGDGFCERFI